MELINVNMYNIYTIYKRYVFLKLMAAFLFKDIFNDCTAYSSSSFQVLSMAQYITSHPGQLSLAIPR